MKLKEFLIERNNLEKVLFNKAVNKAAGKREEVWKIIWDLARCFS